jgi:hypothetical protein
MNYAFPRNICDLDHHSTYTVINMLYRRNKQQTQTFNSLWPDCSVHVSFLSKKMNEIDNQTTAWRMTNTNIFSVPKKRWMSWCRIMNCETSKSACLGEIKFFHQGSTSSHTFKKCTNVQKHILFMWCWVVCGLFGDEGTQPLIVVGCWCVRREHTCEHKNRHKCMPRKFTQKESNMFYWNQISSENISHIQWEREREREREIVMHTHVYTNKM